MSAGSCAAARPGMRGAVLCVKLYEALLSGWHMSRVMAGWESGITITPLSIGNPPIMIAPISAHAMSGHAMRGRPRDARRRGFIIQSLYC